jgi:hypothetical protein
VGAALRPGGTEIIRRRLPGTTGVASPTTGATQTGGCSGERYMAGCGGMVKSEA